MLDYLSLKRFGGCPDVEGLKNEQDWLASVANPNPFDGVLPLLRESHSQHLRV